MNIIATPKSKFEKVVKKCAVSPLKVGALSSFICNLIIIKINNFAQVYNFCPNFHMCF